MTKQEIKKIEKLQNQACGCLNKWVNNGLAEYEAMVYTDQILFNLNPETAIETLSEFITEFKRHL